MLNNLCFEYDSFVFSIARTNGKTAIQKPVLHLVVMWYDMIEINKETVVQWLNADAFVYALFVCWVEQVLVELCLFLDNLGVF